MVSTIKEELKSEHGKGWGVRAMRGKVQSTLRVDGNVWMKKTRNCMFVSLELYLLSTNN